MPEGPVPEDLQGSLSSCKTPVPLASKTLNSFTVVTLFPFQSLLSVLSLSTHHHLLPSFPFWLCFVLSVILFSSSLFCQFCFWGDQYFPYFLITVSHCFGFSLVLDTDGHLSLHSSPVTPWTPNSFGTLSQTACLSLFPSFVLVLSLVLTDCPIIFSL